jgi:hypothetical protein
MKRLRRREAVLLTITALAVGAFVIGAWWVFERIERGHKTEMRAALQTVLETTHQAFKTWAREERAVAQIWAEAPEIVQITHVLLEQTPTKEGLLATPYQDELRSILRRVQEAKGYEGYFVISPDGISLSSSRNENIGTTNLLKDQPEVLAQLWAGGTALSLPQRSDVPLVDPSGELQAGRPTMFVGAPIVDAAGVSIAVLVFRLNPFRDFTALFQRGRIGKTGETYAFDEQGRLISESRFDDQLREIGLIGNGERALLNIEIRDPTVNLVVGEENVAPREAQELTRMAVSAISGESGYDVDGYRDYRGVPVLGAWVWDPDNRLGIASEVDVEEAYETLIITRWMLITLTVIASALMFGLTALFAISQRRAMESAEHLEQALTNVLSGYLRICANCKKIKDDDGEWTPVEKYVGERSKASFTHGMCPECGKAFYGDDWKSTGSS